MNLVKLTFRLADGGATTRLATSAQNIDRLEERYLATIPGAVFCLRCVIEKNISAGRAFWVYQAQHLNFEAHAFRKQRDRAGSSRQYKDPVTQALPGD